MSSICSQAQLTRIYVFQSLLLKETYNLVQTTACQQNLQIRAEPNSKFIQLSSFAGLTGEVREEPTRAYMCERTLTNLSVQVVLHFSHTEAKTMVFSNVTKFNSCGMIHNITTLSMVMDTFVQKLAEVINCWS